MSNEPNTIDRNIPQTSNLDEALLMLSQAQKSIEQLQEYKKLANWFFYVVCNYAIRTPLTAIKGYSELILLKATEGSPTEQLRDDLTIIRKEVDKIQNVLNNTIQVLYAERIRDGLEEGEPAEEVNLEQIIQDKRIVNTNRLKIEVFPDNLPNVIVSQFGLQRTILDIVSILSKDIGEGQVILSINADKHKGIICISNSEVSLSNDTMEKIDKMVDTTTFFAGGFLDDGLIVSINRYFIERFGGRLENCHRPN